MNWNKTKWLNLALVVTFLIGYLEWGKDQKMFIFEAFADIIQKAAADPVTFLHPFILFPLAGFVGILYTLFQNKPSRTLTFLSIGGMALIMVFIFLIGVFTGNIKMIIYNLPFLVLLVVVVRALRNTPSA
jgi:hypothetical protein